MESIELTEREQEFLAEVMRALETERPQWLFEVQPSLTEDTSGVEVLWIEVTRILEGVPQEPTVRNPMARASVNEGDVEALARGLAPAILSEIDRG
jgi:hypothetical protein